MNCVLQYLIFRTLFRTALVNSRPSKTADWDYDFFVDFNAVDAEQVRQVAKSLEPLAKQVHVVGGTGGASVSCKWCTLSLSVQIPPASHFIRPSLSHPTPQKYIFPVDFSEAEPNVPEQAYLCPLAVGISHALPTPSIEAPF